MSSIGLEEFPVAKPARFSAALWAERSTQRHSPAVSVTSGHGLQLSFMRHASKTSVPESQTFAQLPPPPAAVSITVAAARSLRAERIIASRCRRGAYPGGRAAGVALQQLGTGRGTMRTIANQVQQFAPADPYLGVPYYMKEIFIESRRPPVKLLWPSHDVRRRAQFDAHASGTGARA